MKNSTLYALGGLALVVIIAYNCLYVVREIDRAVLLTFGEVTDPNVQPGLHYKIPGMHAVRKFDARIQTLDADTQSYLTAGQEFLDVDSYAKWRIIDTADFYTASSGNMAVASNLLSQRINTGLRNQVSERTVQEVVSGQRDELMEELTANLDAMTRPELGIEIVDVRVKRINLPEQVSSSVYERMNSERREEAQELRSTGREEAEAIRADADRQVTIIQAEAYREAESIRGEGDARATNIYAQAYEKNPEFFEFLRSLQAYRQTFQDRSDVLLVSPENDFFKYLNNEDGTDTVEEATPAAAQPSGAEG